MKRLVIAVLAALAASNASAAVETYTFDTVTAVYMHKTNPEITGVLQNTTDSFTLSFADQGGTTVQYVLNRCLPLIMTAMEKPGRYSLFVAIDTAATTVQLIGCRLIVKS